MKKINYFIDNIQPCHTSMEPNKTYKMTFGEQFLKIEESQDIEYTLNSFGHRSDEFKKEHNQKHILFSGCSISFGESLPYMENWSGRLYNKIKKVENLSGYYNLSYLGGSTEYIIINIINYIQNITKPDTIFCLFPEITRGIKYVEDGLYNYIERNIKSIKNIDEYKLRCYHMIKMLEIYCSAANIDLFWSSWDNDSIKFYEKLKFNNFININNKDVLNFNDNIYESNNRYYISGRDKLHPGILYSEGISNIFLKEYGEKNELFCKRIK